MQDSGVLFAEVGQGVVCSAEADKTVMYLPEAGQTEQWSTKHNTKN